ncbi:MAG TPA: sulfatase [Verrucomicrobiae bacterium]|jgi:arylsulfatase A-like enzyme|nr:sulfatase [Verrucomicrobiae bacterium]
MLKAIHILLVSLLFWSFATVAAEQKLPNIVIILTDDQGYADVGKFGAEGFTTPNLDRLANQGAVFRNFHVAQPICSASRCALMTGCYPNRIGINGALGPNSKIGISDGEETMAQLLKSRGYATGMLGKWHLGDAPGFMPLRHGFDMYFGESLSVDMWPGHPDLITNLSPNEVAIKREYPKLPIWDGEKKFRDEMSIDDLNHLTTWYAERAVKFIDENKSRPFFLYVANNMPHVPLGVSDKFRGKTKRGLYGDVIEEIDWGVGQILDALKRNGLEDNTWVIFTSDNGPWLRYGNHAGSAKPLREGKMTNWEGGTREPCIMRWPGHIPAGADSWSMFMTIDLLPTIAKITGANLPTNHIDGLDVWPVIACQPGAKNPHDTYWFYYDANALQAITTGDGRWKLQFPHTYVSMKNQPPGRDGVPGDYKRLKIETEELYDLANDISETTNVAAQHSDIVKQLEAEAEKARADLGDRLTQRTGSGHRQPGRLVANAVR